jgi:AcrR family transcriptional regulator
MKDRMGLKARTSPRGEPRTPRQARSRRTRQRVLEAAAAAFEERGYDETTTAEIARRARVAVGSVYGYFPDKRAILLEILHETIAQMAEQIVAELDPDRWRDADLRQSVRKLIETIFKTRRLRPGVQRILWERFFKDTEVRRAMEAIEVRVQGAIEELLAALRADGRVQARNPASAAFVIQTSVQWTAARLMLGGASEAEVDAAVDTVSEMISGLMLGAAGAPG